MVIQVVTSPVRAVRRNGMALLFWVAPIKGSGGSTDQEVPDLLRWRVLACLFHHLDLEARHDLAERARLAAHLDHVRDDNIHHLAPSQALHYLSPHLLFKPLFL